MKIFFLALMVTVFRLLSTAQAQVHPIPPGIREADKVEEQTDKNIPPPMTRRIAATPEKLQQDADQLARLAQSIPSDVNQTIKGTLPKDMNNKLKQIEKLAKKLRAELNPN